MLPSSAFGADERGASSHRAHPPAPCHRAQRLPVARFYRRNAALRDQPPRAHPPALCHRAQRLPVAYFYRRKPAFSSDLHVSRRRSSRPPPSGHPWQPLRVHLRDLLPPLGPPPIGRCCSDDPASRSAPARAPDPRPRSPQRRLATKETYKILRVASVPSVSPWFKSMAASPPSPDQLGTHLDPSHQCRTLAWI